MISGKPLRTIIRYPDLSVLFCIKGTPIRDPLRQGF
nr:MAG TPA: hypothetical protein [Caudoviricetes sp.]